MLFDAATCTYAHFVWSLLRQLVLLFKFTARTVARLWAVSLIDRFGRTSSSHGLEISRGDGAVRARGKRGRDEQQSFGVTRRPLWSLNQMVDPCCFTLLVQSSTMTRSTSSGVGLCVRVPSIMSLGITFSLGQIFVLLMYVCLKKMEVFDLSLPHPSSIAPCILMMTSKCTCMHM
jgi:hypothetical protein